MLLRTKKVVLKEKLGVHGWDSIPLLFLVDAVVIVTKLGALRPH
jgi:hypothetical protein